MSHEMSYLGPRAIHHDPNPDAEAHYDHLRDQARQEASKRALCAKRSQEAYAAGDGARAKELSEQAKSHGRKMAEYNRQASQFIFAQNNANGRVAADTIDLHGQFADEAEDILEERIRYGKQHGQRGLHVIVGKGNHSLNHVQKVKPRVEQVCRDLGLQYCTEENAGRIYVNLTGGPAVMPPSESHHPPQHGPQAHPHPQQQHQQQHQQQGNTVVEQVVRKAMPTLLRKLEKACCIVM
ncbi:hypothetical protein PRK78_002095 [Emydomyces testavorans]|uniref:Smr domain-containing protein n=1 Tax=Emydomyces testavorans TaxID=2070801 RepID=A0AAF0DFQ1_9EURO|nr:hypothetical protein PRK78_002095 [Emydomyces testavorans]